MMFEIPDEVLQIGLELQEVIETSAFPSTQKDAMIAFRDYGDVQFLKAVLKYKTDKPVIGSK